MQQQIAFAGGVVCACIFLTAGMVNFLLSLRWGRLWRAAAGDGGRIPNPTVEALLSRGRTLPPALQSCLRAVRWMLMVQAASGVAALACVALLL